MAPRTSLDTVRRARQNTGHFQRLDVDTNSMIEDGKPATTVGRSSGEFRDLLFQPREAKDTHRMPPTTEPVSRNFLGNTVFWITATEQEREAMRTHTGQATRL